MDVTHAAEILYIVGLGAWFAAIAVGMIWVFADRHGYERPTSNRVILGLFSCGCLLIVAGTVLR